jgi:hypothetical protein
MWGGCDITPRDRLIFWQARSRCRCVRHAAAEHFFCEETLRWVQNVEPRRRLLAWWTGSVGSSACRRIRQTRRGHHWRMRPGIRDRRRSVGRLLGRAVRLTGIGPGSDLVHQSAPELRSRPIPKARGGMPLSNTHPASKPIPHHTFRGDGYHVGLADAAESAATVRAP